jgi:hypothetical protein
VFIYGRKGSRGFSGNFENRCIRRGGGGRQKKETRLRGNIDCRLSLALRHPCYPICPRHPYLPKGAKEPGTDAQRPRGRVDNRCNFFVELVEKPTDNKFRGRFGGNAVTMIL